MSIAGSESVFQYLFDGTTHRFVFDNVLFGEGDIAVSTTDAAGVSTSLVLNSDYTVDLEPDYSKATVDYPASAGLESGYITISRDEPMTQLIDYSTGGRFPAETHERGLDRSTLQAQTLKNWIEGIDLYVRERSITYPAAEDVTEAQSTLPDKDARRGQLFGFDVAGDISVYPLDQQVSYSYDGSVELSSGQLDVTFNEASIAGASLIVNGPLVDSRTLFVGVDYISTGANTITLSESYPAGTLLVARFRPESGPRYNVVTRNGRAVHTLSSGQTIVVADDDISEADDLFTSGPLVDGSLLVLGTGFTIGGDNRTITLAESYPSGTQLIINRNTVQ